MYAKQKYSPGGVLLPFNAGGNTKTYILQQT